MSITHGYCTLEELKAHAKITDPHDDPRLELSIETVSRLIDETCGRKFYTVDSESRWFRAEEDGRSIYVDDLLSIDEVRNDDNGDEVYEFLWPSNWYRLEPRNAPSQAKPYRWVERTFLAARPFPIWQDTQITGSWGVPSESPWMSLVKSATIIQAHREFMRSSSPFGVAGANEFGQLIMLRPKLDPDVELLLKPCTRNREVIGV